LPKGHYLTYRLAQAIYVAMIEYCLALGFVKISILIMLRRIFDTPYMRICCNILGIITVLWTLVFLFLGVFQCLPVNRAWDRENVPGRCLDINSLFIANAVPNIVTDAVMVALPIYPVAKLNLPLSQRIAVIGIFLLGSLVCIASIYRLTTVTALDPADIAFTLRGAAVFGHVETAVAIMSACLPTLRPLFSGFLAAIGITKGSYTEKIVPSKGSRSSSPRQMRSTTGTPSMVKSTRTINKKDIFVVISPDGPRLSTKPLPRLPHPPTPTASTVSGEVRNAIAAATSMTPRNAQRDVDLEKGEDRERAQRRPRSAYSVVSST
jgi:hypothetical protein